VYLLFDQHVSKIILWNAIFHYKDCHMGYLRLAKSTAE
jgi:hypothetical protein